MDILQSTDMDVREACLQIGRSLPVFFNELGLKNMAKDLEKHELFVAVVDDEVVGFITTTNRAEFTADVSWMAVAEHSQNKGIGKALISYVSEHLKEQGYRILMVTTLAEEADYEPYAKTRSFYESCGFFLLDTICPYPGWGEDNPCAIYVMVL